MIRVLIIDDSFFARNILKKILFSDGEIEVIGEASNGEEGIKKVIELNPDVVCLDIVMPGEDGTHVLEKIFKNHPTPVVIVSFVSTLISEITKSLSNLGIIEVVHKPDSPENFPVIQNELIKKIKAASRIKPAEISAAYNAAIKTPAMDIADKILAIGCPVSSPVPLEELLISLPRHMSAGIVIRIFMHTQLMDHWVGRITKATMLSGKVAEGGDIIRAGRMLFSPNDKAIEVSKLSSGGVIELLNTERMTKDYIDTMFESASKSFKSNTIAVLLAGAAVDGIEGLRAVKQRGGQTFVQDDPDMPSKIVNDKLAGSILSLADIASEISKLVI